MLLGGAILLVLQRHHHFLVLPCLLLAIPIAFYAVMLSLGYSLPQMRTAGLVAPLDPMPANPFEVWALFDFGAVRREMPRDGARLREIARDYAR